MRTQTVFDFSFMFPSIISAMQQQDEAIKLAEHLNFINANAKEAVALGDNTLKDANNTYHTLAGMY